MKSSTIATATATAAVIAAPGVRRLSGIMAVRRIVER
jgi:hypothetical protein